MIDVIRDGVGIASQYLCFSDQETRFANKIEYDNSSGISLGSCGNHVISTEGAGSNISINGIKFEYIKE